MAYWVFVIPAEQFATERLFAHDGLALPPDTAGVGDAVALVAAGEPGRLFGLGRVRSTRSVVTYTHRLFDGPLPVAEPGAPGLRPVTAEEYEALARQFGAPRRTGTDKHTWLVSVDLPIEAPDAAEAVRLFWTYVYELGPQELPAYVTPTRDELAMQAYVLGAEANLDPEEDD